MMRYRKGSHTVYDIKHHFVWVTKYRFKVLRGPIAHRLRELVSQGCESRQLTIVKGNITKDHVHLVLSCSPSISPSKVVQYLKGRSSRLLQEEYSELKKRYWASVPFFVMIIGTWLSQTSVIVRARFSLACE